MLKKCLIFCIFIFLQNNAFAKNSVFNENSASSIYKNNVVSILYIETQDSSGSGVILKEDGTFVTCFHVIANADYIMTKLEDGSIYYVNGFRYINPLSDVAILTLDAKREFIPITINPLNNLNIGEKIYAISNPHGLQFVFSDGIINQYTKDYIQFSAPISSGSSGGALLNRNGNLLGIITSQFNPSSSQNINFALPNEYYVSKTNNIQIKNSDNLNWTDFLVKHADEEQFKVYTDYALNQENFSMLYKYLKPFLARYDFPEELYPKIAVLALFAYVFDANEDNLNDSIKYFKLSYEKKQNEEAALFALALLSTFTKSMENTSDFYVSLLYRKYPTSFYKLLEIGQKGEYCSSIDDNCFMVIGLEYLTYLMELIGEKYDFRN